MAQEFKNLFRPISMRKLTLKNRIVMSSMSESMCTAKGEVTQREIDYYAERAKNGTALINLGYAFVTLRGKSLRMQLGCYDDAQIPGFRKLTDAVHAGGAKVGLQLSHGSRSSSKIFHGMQPEAASPIPCPKHQEMPEEMSIERIKEVIDIFAQAAARGVKAGFDVVEFHGGHGYIGSNFWSPFSNQRTDIYGGSFEKRLRFGRELFAAMRKAVGEDVPIGCKFSVDELTDEGYGIEEAKEIAKDMEACGVDYIIASAGIYHDKTIFVPPMAYPLGTFEAYAAALKEVLTRTQVGAIARINSPTQAESMLERGVADFVVVGRQHISDPEWVRKTMEGKEEDIRTCIGCNQFCVDRAMDGLIISCVQNAAVGREREAVIVPAEKKKKVVIVGGGVAGMEAARVAAVRGHEVVLYEKRGELGGQVLLAAKPPKREDFGEMASWLVHQIDKLGVKVNLGQEASPEIAKKEKADVVIVAVGAVPVIPNIPGARGKNVVTAFEALREEVEIGQNVVVLGRDNWAIETAEVLHEKGKNVTVIGRGRGGPFDDDWATEWATDISGWLVKIEWFPRLQSSGIKFISRKVVKEITPTEVIINRAGFFYANVQDTNFHTNDVLDERVPADTVVLALAKRPPYADPLKEFEGTAPEVYAIGECMEHPLIRRPRAGFAIHDGFWLGLKI